MNEPAALDDLFEAFADDPDYIAEGIALGVIEDAIALMAEQGMTKAQLAEAMHVSRAYVTQLFNAPPNLTLRTLAQLTLALGVRPVVTLEPDTEKTTRPAPKTHRPQAAKAASPTR